ncbi:MAG TPA: glycosyltransferase family 2 protein [Gaiellales bacterium]|jgi:glycosyltransferase involved in cell wall biosynthesis
MAQAPTIDTDIEPVLVSGSSKPDISVVVTIYNEVETVDDLAARLRASLDGFGRPWEVVFVDDGSSDGSRGKLRAVHENDPRMRVVLLKRNVGQHPAMAAGMQASRGDIVVTMDGDLQNDPTDIPKLVEALEREGVEVASGRRSQRADALMGRQIPSRAINAMLRRLTQVEISDYGCAFNAYRRAAFEPVIHVIGRQKFTKALVLSTGAPVVEVDLINHPREHSKYSRMRLIRLALHVLTGFWPKPIQWAGLGLGLVCGVTSLAVTTYAIVFWIVESNFPGLAFLSALVLGVLAVQGLIMGLLGEYVIRIQHDVERRPLYVIQEILE